MVQTLRKRADFLKVRKGSRLRGPFFLVDMLHRPVLGPDEAAPETLRVLGVRVGYTVTKAQGKAVERNRMKRQLRALAREHSQLLQSGADYVFTGHREMLNTRYATLKAELERRLSGANRPTHARRAAEPILDAPRPKRD